MTRSGTLERRRQSPTAISVFDGEFTPTSKGFECPQCKNHNPQTCDVVKRTCGYLGNPQARPMVHGRHVEISSRVKHMPKLKERYALGVTEDE